MGKETRLFIDIRTDFGFKRVFGSVEHKGIVLRFLNALFEGEFHVDDVEFHDKEFLGKYIDNRRIVYDVYCTTVDDEKKHFILEMQNSYQPNFNSRALYYMSAAIVDQGKKGARWNYRLEPVYTVMVTNFDFTHLEKSLIHDVQLLESRTHEVFSDRLRMLFISLPEMQKEWEECDTELERLIYLIKNMENLDKNSEAYKSKSYDEMFDACEEGMMAAEDVVAYSQSKQRLIDWEEDMKDYRRQVREEALEESRLEIALNMLRNGMTLAQAKICTGLTDADLAPYL